MPTYYTGGYLMPKVDWSTWCWSASEHDFELQSCQRWSSHMKDRIIFQWRTGAVLLNGNEKSTPNLKVFLAEIHCYAEDQHKTLWITQILFKTLQHSFIWYIGLLLISLHRDEFHPLWIFLTALVMFYSNQPSSRIMTRSKGYANNLDLRWGRCFCGGFCFLFVFPLCFF